MHHHYRYRRRISSRLEWPNVTPHTKRLLESAYEIMEACLLDFDPNHIWPAGSDPSISAARSSAKDFRQFLIKHYAKKYGAWPLATYMTAQVKKNLITAPGGADVAPDYASEQMYPDGRCFLHPIHHQLCDHHWKMSYSMWRKQINLFGVIFH